jgi:hypothetical protein
MNAMRDPAEFTDRYQGLMRSYGLESEKTQAGQDNESGEMRLKRCLWGVV